MARLLVIMISTMLGGGFFYWFTQAIKQNSMKGFVQTNQWLLHPNSICYWRAGMAIMAYLMYFFIGWQSLAILIFTFAAILDGVDGVVARECHLGSSWGEWLDPMCDKLTYLPPLIGFAYAGIIDLTMVWILVAIEFTGQFFARKILELMKTSGAANNFGKIKAIICFALVIFCALLEANPQIVNIGDEVLFACILLSAASIVFKFIPSRLYADILSTLNFFCGATSLVLTYNGRFALAICVIIMGQLFDLFDGRMAEKHGGTKYGPLLDDVADFVSFGVAPAYVIIKSGGSLSWIFATIFICGVAYRLIRFVLVDKKRTDLPDGIFNGLPSPAGALIVLGAALVAKPILLWLIAMISVLLMVSRIRFAHFGRVILKTIPRPIFFLASATIVVLLAFVFKTKSATMFGYLILASVSTYIFAGRKWLHR
jgi:CDP-diacylglycerol--serine O-phosphatidyltransferase